MTTRTADTSASGPSAAIISALVRAPFAIAAAAAVIYGVAGFPFAREVLAVALAAYAALLWRFPLAWLLVLPAILPIVNLAMWSGRFFFDEFDFFVLTTLAVNYWRQSTGLLILRPDGKQYAVMYLLAVSMVVSTALMLIPIPPIDANAFSSYLSPYNSLRVGKGFLWAFLLAPQLDHAYRTDARRLATFATTGILAGLFATGIAILWEKGVFVALVEWTSIYGLIDTLLDFSGQYRSTGLFSSMHTGGTAIDGYLTLATPMALAAVVVVKRPVPRFLACAAFGLGLYAIAMTFSRGLYASLAVAIAVLALCLGLRYRRVVTAHPLTFFFWILWFVAATAALTAAYQLGGYTSVIAATAAALLGLLAGFFAGHVSRPLGALAFVAVLALATYAMQHGMVSSKWSNVPAEFALTFAAVISVILGTASGVLGFVTIPRHRAVDIVLLTAILAVIWIGTIPALSGVRMTTRLAATSVDLLTRDKHWNDVISFTSPEFLHRVFGMGTGSFPRHFFVNKIGKQSLVSYEVAEDETGPYLYYGAGDYHIIQRVAMEPGTTYAFAAAVRARHGNAAFYLKICEKNFIFSNRYRPNCVSKLFRVKQSDEFQDISHEFSSGKLGAHGILYWPVTFMFYMGEKNPPIDITSIVLKAPDGTNLIANGDFTSGMDRWTFVSDWEHLAWHTKNILLHVFFEQGFFGLAVYVLFFVLAIGRCAKSLTTDSPFPVVLLPTIFAFLSVGTFGTVIDNPRVAAFLYLTLFVAAFPHGRRYLQKQK